MRVWGVGGYFFLIFVVKCAKFVTCAEDVPVWRTLAWSGGGRALQPENIAHSREGEKKNSESAQWRCSRHSELSGESQRKEGGSEQRHFPVIVPYFIFSPRGQRSFCLAPTGSASGALPLNNNI